MRLRRADFDAKSKNTIMVLSACIDAILVFTWGKKLSEIAREQQILGKIDEILEQGRQNSADIKLIRQSLFGSQEDGFKAGRLPLIESRVGELEEQQENDDNERANSAGKNSVLKVALSWLAKGSIVALSAWLGSIFGQHPK